MLRCVTILFSWCTPLKLLFVLCFFLFSIPPEAPRTSCNKFHDWLEKTIEETTETKDNDPETIEVRVFKNE